MTRYKLTLEFNGTGLIGWQENAPRTSVQSLVQDAIFKLSGARVLLVGAGRTDAGVHAAAMTAHFDLDKEFTAGTVKKALNFYLKNSGVIVIDAAVVSDDFHARFSCTARHYRYIILMRSAPPVLDKDRVWCVSYPLGIDKMKQAAARMIGTHDFTSFRSSECQAKSPVKTLDKIEISVATGGLVGTDKYIIFNVSARSFLHHQVRNIVGTLVDIGRGQRMDIDEIFAAKNRSSAGQTAPAAGLYFISADYATTGSVK